MDTTGSMSTSGALVLFLWIKGKNRHYQNVNLIQELSKAQRKMHVTWKFIGKKSRAGGIDEADTLVRLSEV